MKFKTLPIPFSFSPYPFSPGSDLFGRMETETLAVFWPAVNTVHEMCYSFWPHFLEVDYCTYWKTLQEFYFLDHFGFLTKVKIVVIGAAAAKWPCPSGPAAVNGTNTRQISVQSLCKRYLQITSILLSAMSITCYKILFRHIFTIFYLKKKIASLLICVGRREVMCWQALFWGKHCFL